jgi:hypothetical protein
MSTAIQFFGNRALSDARATGHLMNLKQEGCAPERAEEAA